MGIDNATCRRNIFLTKDKNVKTKIKHLKKLHAKPVKNSNL